MRRAMGICLAVLLALSGCVSVPGGAGGADGGGSGPATDPAPIETRVVDPTTAMTVTASEAPDTPTVPERLATDTPEAAETPTPVAGPATDPSSGTRQSTARTPTAPESAGSPGAIVLRRRDVSEDYVLIGQVTQVGANRSARLKNDSVREWQRRTFRRTESSAGPLLLTSGVRAYTSAAAAERGLEAAIDGTATLEQSVTRTEPTPGTTITVVRFRPETGAYGVTVLYRRGHLLLRVQALDPDSYRAEMAESALLKMIGYAG